MELKIVLLALCVGFVHCGMSYKAAVVDSSIEFNENKAVSMIHEAAQLNVDFLMLPELLSVNNKMRQELSDAAKEAKIYVAAQIMENPEDRIGSQFVWDRNGTIISKPASVSRHTFVTDFGVTFGIVNEVDLLMSDTEGARNVIAFGSLPAGHFLYAVQSSAAWAYTARSNLITARAIYGGHTEQHGGLVIADLNSEKPDTFVVQHLLSDISEHTSESLRGSGRQKVCHENFCCVFDVTTKPGLELPYSLLSYSGVQDVGAGPVRVESCALVACAGRHDSCIEELKRNQTDIFEKVTISAYFCPNSKQYPVLVSSGSTYDDVNFIQNNQTNHASIELLKKEVTSLGIFGISKNVDTQNMQDADDDMSELFDYLWIRLRVAIFIVSIYVLEML